MPIDGSQLGGYLKKYLDLKPPMSDDELMFFNMQRDQAAWRAQKDQLRDTRKRGDGLRIRISRIPGLTKGPAKKALKHPYRFQCPPLEEFQNPTSRTFEVWTNYKGTEFLNRGGVPLKPITFRTVAVEWGSFVVERYYHVNELVAKLRKIAKAGHPFELLATHPYNERAELHMDAVLESVNVSEVAGEPDAKYIDLTFRQWRDPTVKRARHSDDFPVIVWLDKDGSATFEWNGRTINIEEATFAKLAKKIYGLPQFGKTIALFQNPPAKSHGMHYELGKMKRYKDGGKIRVPELSMEFEPRDGKDNSKNHHDMTARWEPEDAD